ncbi:unnamed protein product [Phaedon cochleariae]|uniref:RRM domain-containing protein n=1 Tax=Phaedon cochleariae TaxID=80249 RepID=A0A9P0GPT8_PHACE|nr:unnamed protein product [Phaedon cochleariae]
MSVIIRLQNLPWSANALDIRQYFQGLSIPEGGVHIVGGELGDAFIAFSTDEDARQAFNRNNGKIREVQITLMLSSRTEMQRVIEQARSQSLAAFMQPAPTVVPIPTAVPFVPPVETKKESKERDRGRDSRSRRSRSKSRDKKDRSSKERDRKDKRYRDRSRSRSRDRKSSRRRDRSRGRSRSRDKERRSRDRRSSRRSEERPQPAQREQRKPMPEVWATQPKPLEIIPPAPQPPSLLTATFPGLDQASRTLSNIAMGLQGRDNGYSPPNNFSNGNRVNRESWPPANQSNFVNDNLSNSYNEVQDTFQNRFQNNDFQSRNTNRLEYETGGCCIALEPFYGGYGDIRRFFQGMFIGQNGIKFINDSNGRRTGVVYVKFSNRMMKEEGLDLNGENLNGITVTVSHVSDEEYDNAVDRFIPMTDNPDNRYKSRNISKLFNNAPPEPTIKNYTCLVVDELPTYCKEQDILHMFSQHPLVALILTTKPKGGHIAYVKFSSEDVAKKAHDEKTHHIVQGKPVTVKPCKDEEFDEINKQHEVNLDTTAPSDVGTDCLSVSRLPQKTTDKDIADFFSDIGVIPTKIHLMSNNVGFTGQAYCEFLTTEEASRAAKKNETILNNVSISVTPLKREEMDSILGTTVPAPSEPVPCEPPAPEPEIRRPPPLVSKFTPPPVMAGNFGMRGAGRGFPNRTYEPARGGPRFGPRGPPPRVRFGQQSDGGEDVPGGCTVYIKNVPYKANTNDILEFFEGYHHTGNVSRRYNPNNTPTDEARVTFFDPEEASRALRDLNKCTIWGRQVFLRQE